MHRVARSWKAIANGDGPVLGRELEIAELLRFIKREDIVNTVWLTADVHYCAAHYYDPNKALFQDFEPFWEFVAGPLNAGSVRAERAGQHLRAARWCSRSIPPSANTSPAGGFQFFGQVDIDSDSKDLAGCAEGPERDAGVSAEAAREAAARPPRTGTVGLILFIGKKSRLRRFFSDIGLRFRRLRAPGKKRGFARGAPTPAWRVATPGGARPGYGRRNSPIGRCSAIAAVAPARPACALARLASLERVGHSPAR